MQIIISFILAFIKKRVCMTGPVYNAQGLSQGLKST